MLQPKLNGVIRQSSSDRDVSFAGAQKKIVESASSDVDLRIWCSPIEDQKEIGSCAANAIVGALEMLRIKNGRPHVELSRMALYFNSRLMHRAQDKDEGTIIRLAMTTLSSLGTCPEVTWPYVPRNVFVRPSWRAYREAYANRIGRYELIGGVGHDRIAACIDALEGGYPIAFGMDVTQSFVNDRSGHPYFNGPSVGNHAMLIVGYKRSTKEFIVRNSWGASWGDDGVCYLNENVLDDRDAFDFWVPYESPDFFPNAGA